MRKTRRLVFVFSALAGASSVVSLAVVGCGGDDTIISVDASDATVDTSRPDVVTSDAPVSDAGPDAVVVPTEIEKFPDAVSTAICKRFSECCVLDGGTPIDLDICKPEWRTGWELSNQGLLADGVLDGGKVAYNQAKATECLTLISQMTCGTVTPAAYKAITDACFAVAVGTIAPPGACRSSVECAPTAFCDKVGDPDDAGTGQCRTLFAMGTEGCGNFFGNEACSYRSTGAHCDTAAGDGGTCSGTIGDGQPCTTTTHANKSCATGLCGDGVTCGTSGAFTFEGAGGLCDTYRDAGGD